MAYTGDYDLLFGIAHPRHSAVQSFAYLGLRNGGAIGKLRRDRIQSFVVPLEPICVFLVSPADTKLKP
jgi:hypothetical protein